MEKWRVGLTAGFLAALSGIALVLVAGEQKNVSITHAPGGDCYFDQSCDSLPGVLLAAYVAQIGWVVFVVAAVLAAISVYAAMRRGWGAGGAEKSSSAWSSPW